MGHRSGRLDGSVYRASSLEPSPWNLLSAAGLTSSLSAPAIPGSRQPGSSRASGASVVVLDRGQVGSGASSRNAGQVLTGLKLDVGTLVSKYGEARARELFDISRDAMAALERVVADEASTASSSEPDIFRPPPSRATIAPSAANRRCWRECFNHHVTLVEARDQSTELGARGYHGLLVDRRAPRSTPPSMCTGSRAPRRAPARSSLSTRRSHA